MLTTLTALLIAYSADVSPEDAGWLALVLTSRGHTVVQAPAEADVTLSWSRRHGKRQVRLDGALLLELEDTRPTWRLELGHRLTAALVGRPSSATTQALRTHLMLEPVSASGGVLPRTHRLASHLLAQRVALGPTSPGTWHLCVYASGAGARVLQERPAASCGEGGELVLREDGEERAWQERVSQALLERATPAPEVPTPTPKPPPTSWSIHPSVGAGASSRGTPDARATLEIESLGPLGLGGFVRTGWTPSSSGGVAVLEWSAHAGFAGQAPVLGSWLNARASLGFGVWRHDYEAFGARDARLDPSAMLTLGLPIHLGDHITLTIEGSGLWVGRAITHTKDGATLWARGAWGAGAGARLGWRFR